LWGKTVKKKRQAGQEKSGRPAGMSRRKSKKTKKKKKKQSCKKAPKPNGRSYGGSGLSGKNFKKKKGQTTGPT